MKIRKKSLHITFLLAVAVVTLSACTAKTPIAIPSAPATQAATAPASTAPATAKPTATQQPTAAPTATPKPPAAPTPTPAATPAADSLVFSEPQEYEGVIPFDKSKDVKIHFYLAADGAKITQIDFSMGEMPLVSKDSGGLSITTTFNDASFTDTTGYDVKNGKITAASFYFYDLTVTRACIYGMIHIETTQNGTLLVNDPVYMVIPNITTPGEIPAGIMKP